MTLFKVATTTKKIIVGIVIVISLILVARIVIFITERVSETLILKATLETRGFGNLPALPLKQIEEAENVKQTFKIETTTGKLPSFPSILNVYRLKQRTVDLSSEAFAKEVASKFGFKKEPKKLSSIEWFWEEGGKRLEFNVQTRHFVYVNSRPIINEGHQPLKENSEILRRLCGELGYKLPDSSRYVFTYLRKEGEKWTTTIDKSADWLRIDVVTRLTYAGTNEGEVVSPTYFPSLVYATIPNDSEAELSNVAEMKFSLWDVETDTVQTYKAIDVNSAYLQLQKGEGVLVYVWSPFKNGYPDISNAKEVRITDVKVGYFLSSSNLLYAQPIYIFYGAYGEGEDRINFIYYVRALP